MNKTIAAAAIAGVAILSPVASMGITPVREALLGLAPEDQILTLADKIDESRVANDQKISALEQELATAKQTITDQKETLDNKELSINQKIEDIEKTQTSKECTGKLNKQLEYLANAKKNLANDELTLKAAKDGRECKIESSMSDDEKDACKDRIKEDVKNRENDIDGDKKAIEKIQQEINLIKSAC
jgi:hypothetical protein